MKKIILIICFVLLACSAQAQFKSGLDLYRGCLTFLSEDGNKKMTTDDILDFGYTVGYISGSNEINALYNSLYGKSFYCPPKEGMQYEQLALILINYGKTHPKDLSETARVFFVVALKDSFPCPNE